MEPIVTAALIGAGSSALNSGGDWFSQNRQMDFSREMMDKANQFSLDMWNRTNEYNDPKNQVQRLRDAGLNPMYYGLDGSSAKSFESAQALGYDRASLNVGNPLGSMVSAAQIENLRADTAKKSNESLTEVTRREKMQADIDKVKADISLAEARTDLTKAQKKEMDIINTWANQREQANIAYTESRTRLSDSQKNEIDELLSGKKMLQEADFNQIQARIQEIYQHISNMAGENAILKKDLENYALNHTSNGFMGTGLSLQNILRGALNIPAKDNSSPSQNNQGGSPGTDYMDVQYPND